MLREPIDFNKAKEKDFDSISATSSTTATSDAEKARIMDELGLIHSNDIFDKGDSPASVEASATEQNNHVNPSTAQYGPINPETFIPPFAPPSFYSAKTSTEDTAESADDVARVAEGLDHPHINDTSDKVSSIQEVSTETEVGAAVPSVGQTPQTPSSVGIADPIDEDELEEIHILTYGASCMKDLTSKPLPPPRYIIQDVLPIGVTGFIMPNDLKAKSFIFELPKSVETGTPLLGKQAILKTGDLFCLQNLERNAELTMMQEENLLHMNIVGMRYQVLEKDKVHLKSRNIFKEAVEIIHTKTVILIDGVFQSYMEKTFAKQSDAVIMAGAKFYLEALKKFAHAHDVAVIVPLYLHRKLEKKIAKEMMALENRELADTILNIKGNADKGEYRLDVSRRGSVRMALNILWTPNGWAMKQPMKRGKKSKA